MIKRRLWSTLAQEIETEAVVVITGPRQVGKTTTLKWLLSQVNSPHKAYFDLENLAERDIFDQKNYLNVVNILQNRGLDLTKPEKVYLALDEIQLLPNLPSVVKYLYDHYQVKFFLSGSSSYYLKNLFRQSLAGRKLLFELLPLSFQEFLDFQGVGYVLPEKLDLAGKFDLTVYNLLSSYYEEYIEYGGLPAVVLADSSERKKRLLEEAFSAYINLDVTTLADFRSLSQLRQVIQLTASRIGSRLNINELANIVGVSRQTIIGYLEFLEATYLIKTVPLFSRSLDVRERSLKKIYFVDTGIANVNADLSGGAKFENTVRHQLGFYGQLFYWQRQGKEIDFVLKNEDELAAFEVKETPTASDLSSLRRRVHHLGTARACLVGRYPSARFKDYLWGGLIG